MQPAPADTSGTGAAGAGGDILAAAAGPRNTWPPPRTPPPPSETSPRLARLVDLPGFPDAADPIARELIRCNRNLWVEIADGMSALGKTSPSCYLRHAGADLVCVFSTKTLPADLATRAAERGWVSRQIDSYNVLLVPASASKAPRSLKINVPRVESVHLWSPTILDLETLPLKMEPHPSLVGAYMAYLDIDAMAGLK